MSARVEKKMRRGRNKIARQVASQMDDIRNEMRFRAWIGLGLGLVTTAAFAWLGSCRG